MSNRSLIDVLIALEERTSDVGAEIHEIKDTLSEIRVTLAVQANQLALHMKRSDANEAAVEELKKQSAMVQGVGVFLGILGLVATVYAAVK